MTDELVLNRGVGQPSTCRSCKRSIVFAVMYSSGKRAPFEVDAVGEWTLENGIAKHVGPPSPQLELGGESPAVQRYTSHFSRCPQSQQWRK